MGEGGEEGSSGSSGLGGSGMAGTFPFPPKRPPAASNPVLAVAEAAVAPTVHNMGILIGLGCPHEKCILCKIIQRAEANANRSGNTG